MFFLILYLIDLNISNGLFVKIRRKLIKNEGEIDFYKSSLFYESLVCDFHQKPIEHTDFDCLYLKSYLEFFKRLKMSDSSYKTIQNKSTEKKRWNPPPPLCLYQIFVSLLFCLHTPFKFFLIKFFSNNTDQHDFFQ